MKGSMHRKNYSGRRQCAKSRRAAFTLIEVLFGIALLGFLAIAFSAAFPLASRMQSSARYRAQAVRIARRELEGIRRMPYTSLAPYTNLASPTTKSIASSLDVDANHPFPITNLLGDNNDWLPVGVETVRIDEVTTADPSIVSASATNLRRITVAVSWKDPSVANTTRTVTLQSLVSYLEKKK